MTTAANPPDIAAFFDEKTFTVSYVVSDPAGDQAVIIDPVLDYAPSSGRTSTASADKLVAYVNERRLTVGWSLETHAHADHLTAAQYIKQKLGAGVAIGAHISAVQQTFSELFNLGGAFPADGSQFDRLLAGGDTLEFGGLTLSVMHTPGHTPACSTYVIGDAAFVGDTIFQPDLGTARCDFPGGDAATLYRSIRRILSLPPETRIFTCHDYGPNGRPYAWNRPSPRSARATSTCATGSTKRPSSKRAPRATARWPCPGSLFRRSRSTFAPGPCRPPRITASAISRFP